MSKKKPILVRMDPRTLKALEKWAADEFRSTNGQIEYLLEQALRKAGRLKAGRSAEEDREEGGVTD
ncbi:MAG: hypothetical protein RBT38_08515 [Bacteroidales bacterium]|jgi:hypothetical protein|nr:hypothetical protein [Bacteroidales bacterium]